MKVIFVYRHAKKDFHSLEELFRTIAAELRKQTEVIEYETGSRWHFLRDLWRLRTMRADVYHVVGDIHYFVPLLPHNKTVLTVLDINHYLFGLRGFKRSVYKWLWLLWPIRASDKVTAISKTTQDNIVNYLGFRRSRIEIINCCHSLLFKPIARPFNRACPVILQVGTRPNKNVPHLIDALGGIKCQLVLIGQLDNSLEQKLIECGIDYINRTDLTHEEIYQQYVNCDIVAFVSLAEGFGVPIIEAQATGRPLITANLSPMREVAGEGACLVDPHNVSEIRAGILRIISDADYRAELVKKGLHNAERYSPSTISQEYFALYRRTTALTLSNQA